MVEPDMPHMTNIIWCMHIACWITKATHTHTHTHTQRIHTIYCFSMTTMVVQTCLNVTLYIYCLSCWKYQRQTFPIIHKYERCTLHKICIELTVTISIKMCAIKNIPALVIVLSSLDITGFTMHCTCMESGQVSYRDKLSLFNTTPMGSFACSCLYLQLFPSPLTSLWSDH